jgi:WD40 repeat protein
MIVGRILFAGCSDGTISCWDLRGRSQVWTLKGPSDGVRRMAMTATRLYVCSGSGTITHCQWVPPGVL